MSDRNHPLAKTLATLAQSNDHLTQAQSAPRCIHVKANGVRCGSPAMRRNPWCFFHDRFYNAPYEDTFPPLENPDAVQVALMQVLNRLRREALRPGSLDVRLVNSLLYGLQTAAFNARHTLFDSAGHRDRMVTDAPSTRSRADLASGAPDPPAREPSAERKGPSTSPTQGSRPGLVSAARLGGLED